MRKKNPVNVKCPLKKCSSEKCPTLPCKAVVMHSVCYCEEIQDIRAGATVVCVFFHLYLLCTYRTITRGPFWVFKK